MQNYENYTDIPSFSSVISDKSLMVGVLQEYIKCFNLVKLFTSKKYNQLLLFTDYQLSQ